jgi:hypothetical protein
MSEKGKNPNERSKGGSRKTQMEQALRPERRLVEDEDTDERVEESLREKERKPNRP